MKFIHVLKNLVNSPFKFPKVSYYIGVKKYGTPYLIPHKKITLDITPLYWKTKWSSTDYRFEFNPTISLVFFNLQIYLSLTPKYPHQYWTSFLYYVRNTNEILSKQERINLTIKNFPLIFYVFGKNRDSKKIDYYPLILKSKYLKLYN